MKRDSEVFPHDENGDVIWQMYKNGDDLAKERKFDFFVLFPTEDAAYQFSIQVLKTNQKPKYIKSDSFDKLEWEVKANPILLPTYQNISDFEKKLGEEAAKFGGRNDGWGSYLQNVNIFRKLFRIFYTKFFISESNPNNIEWKVASHTYEGFPLMIRYPSNLNYDELQKNYSLLLEVEFSFAEVLDNGLPAPEYNKSKLFDIDNFLTSYHRHAYSGQCVLVETFGGKRIYYIYVSPKFENSSFQNQLSNNFPELQLDFRLMPNVDWSFIKKYSSEYFS